MNILLPQVESQQAASAAKKIVGYVSSDKKDEKPRLLTYLENSHDGEDFILVNPSKSTIERDSCTVEVHEEIDGKMTMSRFDPERCVFSPGGLLTDNWFHSSATIEGVPAKEGNRKDSIAWFDETGDNEGTLECGASRADFCTANHAQRAMAYRCVADYYGMENLDGYPEPLEKREANSRARRWKKDQKAPQYMCKVWNQIGVFSDCWIETDVNGNFPDVFCYEGTTRSLVGGHEITPDNPDKLVTIQLELPASKGVMLDGRRHPLLVRNARSNAVRNAIGYRLWNEAVAFVEGEEKNPILSFFWFFKLIEALAGTGKPELIENVLEMADKANAHRRLVNVHSSFIFSAHKNDSKEYQDLVPLTYSRRQSLQRDVVEFDALANRS